MQRNRYLETYSHLFPPGPNRSEFRWKQRSSCYVSGMPPAGRRPPVLGFFLVFLVSFLSVEVARAQPAEPDKTPPGSGAQPFQILDNSFLVEEAFNQEAGVFQNIFGIFRTSH